MGVPSGTRGATGFGTRDLGTFNHWLCVTRLRAAAAVAAFTLLLRWLDITDLAVAPVLAVCAALGCLSAVGLTWAALPRRPLLFFYAQTFADLAAITVGIGAAVEGLPALLFRPIYVLVIVPASLVSVPAGLAAATAATLGHGILLALDHGYSAATVGSFEALVPTFLFFLTAQQSFFYGAHIEAKNVALAGLATRLEENRAHLVAESRMAAALVDVARTLSSTLEAPELLARVNASAHEQLGADWSATFLVDTARASFRLAASTDGEVVESELGRIEFPMHGWPVVERLAAERVLVLTGAEAARMPHLLTGGRGLATALLAALYHDDRMVGFFAVGYGPTPPPARERALRVLGGIAQHATIALRNARLLDEVRQASALKSEFVGTISHELRSPLNVVLGYLEMILDGELGPLTDEQRHALQRTQRQSLELLEMISALLDLNRLEAGRLPVHARPVSIGAVLEELRAQLPDNWRRPGVELHLQVAPDLPVVDTDPGKLKTVLRNLVHNAFKFTARGHVTVAAALSTDGEIVLTVTDTGRGIPADAIDYVFDMFRQVHGAGGGGVGLGLHIVRRFVEALGGVVSVTSRVGVGSRFTVILPRTTPAAHPTAGPFRRVATAA